MRLERIKMKKLNLTKIKTSICDNSYLISVEHFCSGERFNATKKDFQREKKYSPITSLNFWVNFVIKIYKEKKAGEETPAFGKKHLGGYP